MVLPSSISPRLRYILARLRLTSRERGGDDGGADGPDRPLHLLNEDKYVEVVLERLQEEVELPLFQELEEVKLKPSIFGLMCKELVVAQCIDLFASNRHHQLPRYYSVYVDDRAALGHNAFAYVWDPGVCLYANPPWTLIVRVLDKIAKDGSRVLLVTPHWQEAPWYELLLELTVRSYEWRGKLYLTEGGNLQPIPKWHTLFSYVVGKRRVLTEAELAEELAGEQ